MVVINFYQTVEIIDQIPESFAEFSGIAGVLLNINEPQLLTYEYTLDNQKFYQLSPETYDNFFMSSYDAKVYIYLTKEEANFFKEEEKLKNVKNNEIEITKEMVYKRIIEQQKEKMRLKQLKEKEEQKKIEESKKLEENKVNKLEEHINEVINNSINIFKDKLINESKIKYSEILSQSRINLKNEEEKKENNIEIKSLEKHPGVKCNECNNEIIGDRYMCVFCEGFNYCSKCEEVKGNIHGHPMYKLKLRLDENINI